MHAVKLVHIIVNFLFFRQGSCSVGCCSRIGPLNKVGFEYKIFVEHSSHEILTDYVDFYRNQKKSVSNSSSVEGNTGNSLPNNSSDC